MSLDTGTLTGTNIPSIAARNVEQRIKTLYDAIQVATEAFFASQGITATFYAGPDGEPLDISADAVSLLTPIVENDWENFPASYWTDEENRLNANVMTIFPEMSETIIPASHG